MSQYRVVEVCRYKVYCRQTHYLRTFDTLEAATEWMLECPAIQRENYAIEHRAYLKALTVYKALPAYAILEVEPRKPEPPDFDLVCRRYTEWRLVEDTGPGPAA